MVNKQTAIEKSTAAREDSRAAASRLFPFQFDCWLPRSPGTNPGKCLGVGQCHGDHLTGVRTMQGGLDQYAAVVQFDVFDLDPEAAGHLLSAADHDVQVLAVYGRGDRLGVRGGLDPTEQRGRESR